MDVPTLVGAVPIGDWHCTYRGGLSLSALPELE